MGMAWNEREVMDELANYFFLLSIAFSVASYWNYKKSERQLAKANQTLSKVIRNC